MKATKIVVTIDGEGQGVANILSDTGEIISDYVGFSSMIGVLQDMLEDCIRFDWGNYNKKESVEDYYFKHILKEMILGSEELKEDLVNCFSGTGEKQYHHNLNDTLAVCFETVEEEGKRIDRIFVYPKDESSGSLPREEPIGYTEHLQSNYWFLYENGWFI